ncbi:outer membrane beta-barrel protein [Marinobacter sp. VGCF2001]|uniref:outer membrane beta-barrel protein n=1 Tax=Marinobacter sp. VGCF2001 TaxID=3417189 RepID=UPI003CFA03F3
MADQLRVRKAVAATITPLMLAAGACSFPAFAQAEITFGLDSRFTDNARKAEVNEDSDLETRTYLTAGYQTEPGRCNADFLGTLGYSFWQDETFDNESFAEMNFEGDCKLANQLYWEASNNLREVNQDTRQSDIPDNRTRKNVFSTGPRYLWRLNDTNWLNLSARYANTEYDEPEETDSERYTGSIAWNHLFSSTFTGGLSVSHSRTEFDYGAEVDVSSAQITFENRWASTSLSGSVGVSEVETDYANTSQSSDGFVGELNLTRQINPTTEWYLNASRELTDRTSTLDLRFGEFEFNLRESITVENSALASGFKKTFSDASSFNLDLYAYRSDYLESDEREDKAGINARYSRQFSELTTGYLGLGFDHLNYESDDSQDEVARLVIGAEHQATRDLSVLARVGHDTKSSDFASREYDENWVLVGLEYRLR